MANENTRRMLPVIYGIAFREPSNLELLQRENLAGKVQMIYIDPPYGVKYGSNFQPLGLQLQEGLEQNLWRASRW